MLSLASVTVANHRIATRQLRSTHQWENTRLPVPVTVKPIYYDIYNAYHRSIQHQLGVIIPKKYTHKPFGYI